MRVTLLHNPGAGHGQPPADALLRLLRDAGYAPAYRSTREDGWERALDDPGELVVAAGGDGTVGKVARVLEGREVPLALLPLGTANNVAATLGVPADPAAAVAAWRHGRPRALDTGRARRGRGGACFFLEGVGAGPFARVVGAREGDDEAGSDRTAFRRDLRAWRRAVEDAPARRARVEVDGREVADAWLLVEVLNVGTLGPRIPLAPGADPGDGMLDVALVEPEGRDALLAYLDARLRGEQPARVAGVRVERGRRAVLAADAGPARLDGKLWEEDDGSGAVEVEVRAGALTLLVPGA